MHNDIVVFGEASDVKIKGNWISCKICHKKWKFKTSQARKAWKQVNLQCPFCKEEYAVLPVTERELRKLQDLYFKDDYNEKYLDEIYHIMVKYGQSIIKKVYGSKLNLSEELIDYYSRSATSLLMEKYANKDFEIEFSFAGFLAYKVKEAIFHKKEYPCAQETIHYKHEDGHYSYIEDDRPSDLDKLIEKENKLAIKDDLLDLIFAVGDYQCLTEQEDFLRLKGLEIYFKKGQKKYNAFFNLFGRKGKFAADRTLDIIRGELLNYLGHEDYKDIIYRVQNGL